jgi:MYXO-CTERM domain-containing protein
MLIRFAFPAAALMIVGLVPTSAWAQECTTDADCGDGYQCQTAVYAEPGCADPNAGCASSEPPSEIGWCEVKPISCASDSDCPDFMRCLGQETLCWANSDGTSGCQEVDPSNRSCQAVPISCNADSDCPSSFECSSVPLPCPVYDCAPGTDCPPSNCEGTENVCTPKQLSCATDADCPSSWSCEEQAVDCAQPVGMGGMSGGMDCGSPSFACMPTGVAKSANTEIGTGPEAPPQSTNGGCSIGAPSGSAPEGAWALLATIGLLGFAARRRR